MIEALETISRECFRSFRVLPGARVLDAPDVFGVSTSIPLSFFNGVANTRIEDNERIAQVADWFRNAGVSPAEQAASRRRAGTALVQPAGTPAFRWWITPASRPRDLAERLRAIGLQHAYDSAGMVADLERLPSIQSNIRIERVTRDEDMAAWTHVLMTVFGRPMSDGALWREGFGAIGYGDDATWAHFVAFVNDAPVATTSVMLAGEIAGIYHVGTLAEVRRQGLGAAVTLAGMKYARERGAKTAALQSSESGIGVYQSLGFVTCCTLTLYDWRPL